MRVVSGIQPTGGLHLGNLLGAILRWVRMQDEAQCLFFLADLHALTVDVDPLSLRANVREMAAALIASGIDPAKSTLFAQSAVPAHPELAWILMCTARMGWLNRMTQFKDKSGKNRESSSVGLFTYPVLQAADVLVYRATHVPVGEDQKQHIELANDIAEKFNHDMGTDFFPHIEPMIMGPAARVMSLRDGAKKMSKSDASDQSRINLTDDAETIALKIKRAKTDPEPLPSESEGLEARPEARNLVGIYAALMDTDHAHVLKQFGGQGFGAFKSQLADLVVEKLAPIASETRRLLADPAHVDSVLRDGARRAAALANPIVDEAERLVGFLKV